jgi:hypothetical protein
VEDRAELPGNLGYDCFTKAEAALASGKARPRIFHCCGTGDFLYENARLTAEWFGAHPRFDYSFGEGPGGHAACCTGGFLHYQ